LKISEIVRKPINYERWNISEPKSTIIAYEECQKLNSKMKKYKSEVKRFENKVLIYLFENRNQLGISEIYRLDNCRVDALLKLDDSEVVLAEFKYALNWYTACNARTEIQSYIEGKFHENIPEKLPTKALIIFDHFSRDWDRRKNSFKYKNGWSYFYEEEERFRGNFPRISVDIAQLQEKEKKIVPAPWNTKKY
jgi:hypothetical protein